MSWARLDDTFHSHPKTARVLDDERDGLAAIGLWTLLLSWAHANRRRTNHPFGLVPRSVVRQYAGTRATRLTRILTDAGYLEPHTDGWQLHDAEDYADGRRPGTIDPELSAKRAEAGRRGAAHRWGKPADNPHQDTLTDPAEPPQPEANEPPDPKQTDSKPDSTVATTRVGAHARSRTRTPLSGYDDDVPHQPDARETDADAASIATHDNPGDPLPPGARATVTAITNRIGDGITNGGNAWNLHDHIATAYDQLTATGQPIDAVGVVAWYVAQATGRDPQPADVAGARRVVTLYGRTAVDAVGQLGTVPDGDPWAYVAATARRLHAEQAGAAR